MTAFSDFASLDHVRTFANVAHVLCVACMGLFGCNKGPEQAREQPTENRTKAQEELERPPAPGAFEPVDSLRADCLAGVSDACVRLIEEFGKVAAPPHIEPALPHYRRACENGGPKQCAQLGNLLIEHGSPASHLEAAEVLTPACERDSAMACHGLARIYAAGLGVEQDLERGLGLHERACAAGTGISCWALAVNLENGEVVGQDLARAREYALRACELGEHYSCEHVLVSVAKRADRSSTARALALLAQACDAGSGDACAYLGRAYEGGLGVAEDIQRARSLYERGCDLPSRAGCGHLGRLYYHGLGVELDLRYARALWEKGCAVGDGNSCYNAGAAAANGDGGPQDFEQAKRAMALGCDANVDICCDASRKLASDHPSPSP